MDNCDYLDFEENIDDIMDTSQYGRIYSFPDRIMSAYKADVKRVEEDPFDKMKVQMKE